MAKLYRSFARRGHQGTLCVTVELPVAAVAVLVASARAEGILPECVNSERFIPQLLAFTLCEAAAMATDYVDDEGEGQGVRCFALDNPDYNGYPISARVVDGVPEVRGSGLVPVNGLRPWWLNPSKSPKVEWRWRQR